jgi:UDP-N-acetylmuramate--alanine ligase
MRDRPWSGRTLHFVAIGGAGMSGLALVARELGAVVTGSDRAESSYLERLRAAGLEPRVGHDAAAVPPDAEVVVSSAVGEENPELAVARERRQRVIHRGELLAEVCALRRLIAVAGTHGKTTTAGMLVHALRELGADPPFLIGGELLGTGDAPANAGWAAGEWIVAEADESDASFLRLRPEVAAVTNVELDHHSRWRSRAELLAAFREFAAPAASLALLSDATLDPLADSSTVLRFDASRPGPAALALAVPGRHNVLNARAAIAAAELAGFGPAVVADALRSFPGIARRLERKGVHRSGAIVYDDYAHHPTEVAATLAALRELGPRRLLAVFQPHLYSRTKALAATFGRALAGADAIGVLDVYPAREEPVGGLAGVSGLDVARAAADRAEGRPVWWLRDLVAARLALEERLREGDVLVTIGAGDVFELADALVEQVAGSR